MSTRVLVAALALLALTPARAAAQHVLVVGTVLTPIPHYSTVQAAVDAAADGDVVLILPGSFDTEVTIQDRELSLVGITGPAGNRPSVGSLIISELAPSHSVVLRGFDVTPFLTTETLAVLDCDGPVLLEDMQVSTLLNFSSLPFRIEHSGHVVITRSTLHGGRGAQFSLPGNANGGLGLRVSDATVALYDTQVFGGDGADAGLNPFLQSSLAGVGGLALSSVGGTILLAGSTVQGGVGGDGYSNGTICLAAADGGVGLLGDGLLRRLDSTIAGGAPGATAGCGAAPQAGTALDFSGTLVNVAETLRRLKISSPIEQGGSCTISVQGAPNEAVLLLQALAPLGSWVGGLKGTLAGAPPYSVFALGPTGGDGALSFSVPLPANLLPAGVEAVQFIDQCVVAAGSGGGLLSSPSAVVLVDDLP